MARNINIDIEELDSSA